MTKVEQFIKDYTQRCSNELCYEEGLGNLYEPWLTPEQALRAVEIEREETIDKACEWWKQELEYPSMTPEEIKWYKNKINKFRKAMEG